MKSGITLTGGYSWAHNLCDHEKLQQKKNNNKVNQHNWFIGLRV